MTLDDIKRDLQTQIEQASADVATKQAALRTAETQLAFLQGQLHALNMIHVETPIYSNGIEETQ